MMRKTLLVAMGLGAALAAAPVAAEEPAVPPPAPAGSTTETRGFVGVNWTFGAKRGPELVLGVARAKTKADGDVQGARLSAHVGLGDGGRFNGVKLTGFAGREKAQAEIGLGYGGGPGGVFGVVGVIGPHVQAGVDIYFSGDMAPYVGLHSMKKFRKPAAAPAPVDPGDGDGDDGGEVEATGVF